MRALWVLGVACALNAGDIKIKISDKEQIERVVTMRDDDKDGDNQVDVSATGATLDRGQQAAKKHVAVSLLEGPQTRAECLGTLGFGGRTAVSACSESDPAHCAGHYTHAEHAAHTGDVVLCEASGGACVESDTLWHYTCPGGQAEDGGATVVTSGDGCGDLEDACGQALGQAFSWDGSEDEVKASLHLCCVNAGHEEGTCEGIANAAFLEYEHIAEAPARDERFCHMMGDLLDQHMNIATSLGLGPLDVVGRSGDWGRRRDWTPVGQSLAEKLTKRQLLDYRHDFSVLDSHYQNKPPRRRRDPPTPRRREEERGPPPPHIRPR